VGKKAEGHFLQIPQISDGEDDGRSKFYFCP